MHTEQAIASLRFDPALPLWLLGRRSLRSA